MVDRRRDGFRLDFMLPIIKIIHFETPTSFFTVLARYFETDMNE